MRTVEQLKKYADIAKAKLHSIALAEGRNPTLIGRPPRVSAEEKKAKRALRMKNRWLNLSPEEKEKIYARKNESRNKKLREKAAAEGKEVRVWRLNPEDRPAARRARVAKYRKNNLDKNRLRDAEYKRQLRATPDGMAKALEIGRRWRERHPEKVKERNQAWYSINKDRHSALGHAYRARKKSVGGKFTPADIAKLMELQKGKCSWCLASFGSEKPNIDHYIPIKLGGSNNPENLRLLHKSCNSMKSSKHPIQFAQQNGLLCW